MRDREIRLFFCPLFTGQRADGIRGKRDCFTGEARGREGRAATAYTACSMQSGSVTMRGKGCFAADRTIPYGKWGLLW